MRVLVCGSRDLGLAHYTAILFRLARLPKGTVVVHGACRGADELANIAAMARELTPEPHPVPQEEWLRLGKRAGPLRNQRMLDAGRPDLVLAFHTDPGLGKGTADMVRRAKAAGVPVEVHLLEEKP